jgi:hypothetical protein
MNDLTLANDIERWLAGDPDHMGLHSLSEAQWRAIVAALRRGSDMTEQMDRDYRSAMGLVPRPERPPSGEMVMVLKSFAENRCYACGWPLAGSATNGCTPFNCSYRPSEQSAEHTAWLKKAREMERVRALLSAAEAEGRKG